MVQLLYTTSSSKYCLISEHPSKSMHKMYSLKIMDKILKKSFSWKQSFGPSKCNLRRSQPNEKQSYFTDVSLVKAAVSFDWHQCLGQGHYQTYVGGGVAQGDWASDLKRELGLSPQLLWLSPWSRQSDLPAQWKITLSPYGEKENDLMNIYIL